MKKLFLSRFRLLSLVLCVSLSLSSCETIKQVYRASTATVSESTTTELIVSAEKLSQIGDDAMNSFLKWEHARGAAAPKAAREFAETLRADKNENKIQDGIDAEITLRVATKELKANRNAAGEANLRTAYATFKALVADCQKYSGP